MCVGRNYFNDFSAFFDVLYVAFAVNYNNYSRRHNNRRAVAESIIIPQFRLIMPFDAIVIKFSVTPSVQHRLNIQSAFPGRENSLLTIAVNLT